MSETSFGRIGPPRFYPNKEETQDERDARIRRESRQRCLDEFECLSKNDRSNVGVDVERVYLLSIQRAEQQEPSKD
jgi:hypothetical protein